MEMKSYVIGSAVMVEATIQIYTNFGSLAKNDPTSVTITITNPSATKVVDAQVMTKHATGEYYYILQTTSSDKLGVYTATIAIDGVNYDASYVTNRVFQLVSTND